MATEYYYKKYCKQCGVLTDSWKISKQYFEFLKRSPGIKYPEERPAECTYDWICEKCAPDYYADPEWEAPEPFKRKPLPAPKISTARPPAAPAQKPTETAQVPPPAAPAAPRISPPKPPLRTPPVATPPVSAKPSTPEKQDKIASTPAAPRFKVPKLNK